MTASNLTRRQLAGGALALATTGLLGAPLTARAGDVKRFMTRVGRPEPIQAAPDRATLVFVRPSAYGGAINLPILDERGGWVGESRAKAYFSVTIAPGEQTFVVWSEGTNAMRGNFEAGKLYYVEVGFIIGAWSGRGRLFPIGPERPQWAELPGWLDHSERWIVNDGAPEDFAREDGAEAKQVAAKGVANYAGYTGEDLDMRTVRASDGVTAPV
ncbi:MAG: hypothetical protein ABMB14_41335 [Myxococcota bacterium]